MLIGLTINVCFHVYGAFSFASNMILSASIVILQGFAYLILIKPFDLQIKKICPLTGYKPLKYKLNKFIF